MKRVWGRVLAGVLVLGIGSIAVAACKSDDSTLFVQDVLSAPFVTAGQQCTFTADPTQPTLSSGELDWGLRQSYTAEFLVGNQAVPEVNSQQLATETNIIQIQGATVKITDVSGNQINYYSVAAAATIYPSSGGVPGYAPISLTILDTDTLANDAALQSNIASGGTTRFLTYIQFYGQTTGGTTVKSGTFEFPVDVCLGCLVGFTNSPAFPLPNCSGSSASSSSSLPTPCIEGQDFTFPCSDCLGLAVCRGAGTTIGDGGAG